MPTVSTAPEGGQSGRGPGKYITLAILIVWVLGVFLYTVLKFAKVIA